MNKRIVCRLISKNDTEENWLKNQSFVPMKGEQIVYLPDDTYNYFRFKFGDGVTPISTLHFFNGNYNDLENVPQAETWTFTLSDGSTVSKQVVVR